MNNIIPKENCLTEVQLLHYLHDECRTDEVRAIDHHLTHCPMCSDALDGIMLLGKGRLERSLKHLDAQIDTRFSSKNKVFDIEKPVLTVVKKSKNRPWLWAAASIAILATAGIVLLTKPFDPTSTVPTVANTDGTSRNNREGESTPYQPTNQETISPQNGVAQTNPLKNLEKTGVNRGVVDNKTPETTNIDMSKAEENPVLTTTTNGAKSDVESTKPEPIKTTENTEGDVSFVQKQTKDVEAKRQEVVAADANKIKEKQARQAQAAPSSVNNYPGAAAQNVVVESKAKATREKLPTDNGLADYQIGMQYYTKEDYNQAIAQLNRVLAKQSKGVVYDNALWYLANSYLKLDKKQEGRALLQRIVTEKGKYASQAAALLK